MKDVSAWIERLKDASKKLGAVKEVTHKDETLLPAVEAVCNYIGEAGMASMYRRIDSIAAQKVKGHIHAMLNDPDTDIKKTVLKLLEKEGSYSIAVARAVTLRILEGYWGQETPASSEIQAVLASLGMAILSEVGVQGDIVNTEEVSMDKPVADANAKEANIAELIGHRSRKSKGAEQVTVQEVCAAAEQSAPEPKLEPKPEPEPEVEQEPEAEPEIIKPVTRKNRTAKNSGKSSDEPAATGRPRPKRALYVIGAEYSDAPGFINDVLFKVEGVGNPPVKLFKFDIDANKYSMEEIDKALDAGYQVVLLNYPYMERAKIESVLKVRLHLFVVLGAPQPVEYPTERRELVKLRVTGTAPIPTSEYTLVKSQGSGMDSGTYAAMVTQAGDVLTD